MTTNQQEQSQPQQPVPTAQPCRPEPTNHYAEGRMDRVAGKPCRSTNGQYLDGWYSVPNPTPSRNS